MKFALVLLAGVLSTVGCKKQPSADVQAASSKRTWPVDVMFVIDLSERGKGDLQILKDNAESFYKTLADKPVSVRIGVKGYRPGGVSTQNYPNDTTDLITPTSIEKFQAAIANWTTSEGISDGEDAKAAIKSSAIALGAAYLVGGEPRNAFQAAFHIGSDLGRVDRADGWGAHNGLIKELSWANDNFVFRFYCSPSSTPRPPINDNLQCREMTNMYGGKTYERFGKGTLETFAKDIYAFVH